MKGRRLPKGFTEDKIAAIAARYESQSDREAEAEVEAAFADPRFSMIQVPVELVEQVRRVLAGKATSQVPTTPVSGAAATLVKEGRRPYPAKKGKPHLK